MAIPIGYWIQIKAIRLGRENQMDAFSLLHTAFDLIQIVGYTSRENLH